MKIMSGFKCASVYQASLLCTNRPYINNCGHSANTKVLSLQRSLIFLMTCGLVIAVVLDSK